MVTIALASILIRLVLVTTMSDVAADSLQQQQLLRQLLLNNQSSNQLRVVWQPSTVSESPDRLPSSKQVRRWLRQPRFLAANQKVLKAGYGGRQSQPAAAPPHQPRIFVISAPAPATLFARPPAPRPPQQSSYPMPAAPRRSYAAVHPMPSYPAPASQRYTKRMPVAQAAPASRPNPSYRVIYVQSPAPAPAPVSRPVFSYRTQADTSSTAAAAGHGSAANVAAPSSAPSQQPASVPARGQAATGTASAAGAAAAAADGGSPTLFILMPATPSAMAAVKASGGVPVSAMSYALPPLPPCPSAPTNFCYSKYVGHYEHPNDQSCYVVCNDFGNGFTRRCARGTKWKRHGEPAGPSGYNRCA